MCPFFLSGTHYARPRVPWRGLDQNITLIMGTNALPLLVMLLNQTQQTLKIVRVVCFRPADPVWGH